jgi:hypothetical protein
MLGQTPCCFETPSVRRKKENIRRKLPATLIVAIALVSVAALCRFELPGLSSADGRRQRSKSRRKAATDA